jgi:hypothetical protein
MSFHTYSKSIVEDYLSTVAYVDDLIFSNRIATKAVDIGDPDMRAVSAKNPILEKVEKVEETVPVPQLIPNINPLTFTNAFLEKGINCALIELSEDRSNIESIKKTLKKSDVIILDWQMHSDLGRNACELVELILSEDKNKSLSLRLLVIYTDQPVYNTLIRESVVPIFDSLKISYNVSASGTEIISGHTKIIVFQKPKLGTTENGKISGEDLPEKIIEELTLLTEGLVSNTALKAVTVIRRSAHKLLGAFNKDLDAAYLAHRAMTPLPEDAEALLKSSIVDSIDSVISYSDVASACNIDQIEKWFIDNTLEDNEITIVRATNRVTINDEERKKWLIKGYKEFTNNILQSYGKGELDENQFENYDRNGLLKNTNDCFIKSGTYSSEDFAILTHHKSNFITPTYVPILTLGVVVQRQDNDKYYLCIQQRCESVRIQEREVRNFLFLPLTENGSYPIIFKKSQGDYIKLKVNINNSHCLLILKFKQTNKGLVQAINEDGGYNFFDTYGKQYKWILDLKESHAQRIANKFASQLSRIGLEESEWLRRS